MKNLEISWIYLEPRIKYQVSRLLQNEQGIGEKASYASVKIKAGKTKKDRIAPILPVESIKG